MSKHTPGPWMIGNIQGDNIVIENHDGFEVCTVWEDPKQHDARLIAAAPDLLEACLYLTEGIESCGLTGVYLDQARKAIAKATGETK